jgi:glutathione S-transferase
MPDLILYQAEWDAPSRRVRRRMGELLLEYYCVNVHRDVQLRGGVEAVSGQRSIPVLYDRGTLAIGEAAILAHLKDAGYKKQ